MSSSLTITTPSGSKIRTRATDKRYFVVIANPTGTLKVIRRTNDIVSAAKAANDWSPSSLVYRQASEGTTELLEGWRVNAMVRRAKQQQANDRREQQVWGGAR